MKGIGSSQITKMRRHLKNKMNQVPVLITGASSQVGRCTLDRLAQLNASVTALGRQLPPNLKVLLSNFIEGDLSGKDFAFGLPIASMIHIAGIWLLPPHIPVMHRNGLRRLVCFSSTSIYNKFDSVNQNEREAAHRMVAAEKSIAQQCEDLGIEWTILRPTLIYGLGLDRNVSRAARFIKSFKFYPLATGRTGLRQPVHADDLAAAAITAMQTDAAVRQCYDVGGGEQLAYREMIGRIFDALNLPRLLVPTPGLEYAVATAGLLLRKPEVTGDVVRRMRLDLVCENYAAEADLNYRPRDFLVGGRDDLSR